MIVKLMRRSKCELIDLIGNRSYSIVQITITIN